MGDVGTRWKIRTPLHKLVNRPYQPIGRFGFSNFYIGCVGMKIKLTKQQFDKIADSLKEIIVSEIDKVKDNIDINNDGYVDFKEFKIVI